MCVTSNKSKGIEIFGEVGIGDTMEEAVKNSEYNVYLLKDTNDLFEFIRLLNNNTQVEVKCTCSNGYTRHMTEIIKEPFNKIFDILKVHWTIIEAEYHELYNKCIIRVKSTLTVAEDIEFEKYIIEHYKV